MDPGFQPGEIIDASIRGLTVNRVHNDSAGRPWVYLAYRDDVFVVDLALPVCTGIRFERVTPADGEPQPGELWADSVETLYVVQSRSAGSARLVDVDAPNSGEPWEVVHRSPQGPIYRVAQRPLIGGQS